MTNCEEPTESILNQYKPCESLLKQYRDKCLSHYLKKNTVQYELCSNLIQRYWLCIEYDSNEN